jgi:hypothetical protein
MISESDALGRALHGLVMNRFKRLIFQYPFRNHWDRLVIA